MAESVALYLQDAHDLRDGLDFGSMLNKKVRCGVAGRESPGARCDCSDGCLCRSDRKNQSRFRCHQQLDTDIGLLAATFLTWMIWLPTA
jgi:hypothetical protein